MIRLVASSKRFKTTITHTGSNSGSAYTITHNLGTVNISVEVLVGPVKAVLTDYFFDGGAQNWGHTISGITLNSFTLQIFKWYPAYVETSTQNADVVVVDITP
jgi:hypothetical protein